MTMKPHQNADIIDAPELHEHTRSGRATWDQRGNTVWEWQTAPGIYSKEISAQQLHLLQARELQLLDQYPGVTSTFSHWKRYYHHRHTPVCGQASELVIPARRKNAANSDGVLDQSLKKPELRD